MNEDLIKKIEDLEIRIVILESSHLMTQPSPGMTTKKLSIKEFLRKLKLSSGVQKTLAIGYFLENYEGIPFFNKNDIEKAFRSAKEKVPLNINDKVGMCEKSGLMMEASTKKESLKSWTLTSSGEESIKKLLV